jgi:magnesium-transporting ATPase (P-type)
VDCAQHYGGLCGHEVFHQALSFATLQEEVWEVLNILEYSSARARMSVIARGPDGGIHVFTKGADARVSALWPSCVAAGQLQSIVKESLYKVMA